MVPKFQLNTLSLEKSFCIKHFLLKVLQLMNKELTQNKVFNYFNIGDAKNLVKLKSCSYTHLWVILGDFFSALVLSIVKAPCYWLKLLQLHIRY